MQVRRAAVTTAVATAVAVLSIASPAFAHIDPDPTEAQAGSDLSVGFTVEHGCDGSPTVQLDMRLPEGASNPVPEPPAGWTGSVEADVVTFVGGPLPDDQPLTFRLRVTLPPTPDTTIYFPFVQRCDDGEIRWIDIPDDGASAELDEPAPAMQLFGPVATTTAPPTTQPAPTSSAAASPTNAPTTTDEAGSTSTSPTSSSSLANGASTTSLGSTDEHDSGSTGTVVFIVVLLALAAMAGIVVFQMRRRRHSSP